MAGPKCQRCADVKSHICHKKDNRHSTFQSQIIMRFVLQCPLLIRWPRLNGKRNETVWRPSVRPSVCLSVCPIFCSNLNQAGAYSTWLTRWQHATRPTYISVPVLRGRRQSFRMHLLSHTISEIRTTFWRMMIERCIQQKDWEPLVLERRLTD